MTTTENIASIVLESAIEQLAKTHGRTMIEVMDGIESGHVKLVAQFKELMVLGAKAAAELHAAGRIKLAC